MNDSPTPRWFSFERRRDHDFEDEPALACFVGKLFHHWQGRNAWWGTWSETYPGDQSFALDLEETKKRIEKKRTQGSQWTIVELPVLVLAGADDALVVGEINTDSPLSEVSMPRTFDRSLEALAQLFHPHKLNSVCRFVGSRSIMSPAHFPFLRYRSESIGSYYELGWNATNGGVEIRPLLSIVTRICKRLQKE